MIAKWNKCFRMRMIIISEKKLTWFDDSPDSGHPDCLCSLCGKVIEDFAIRMWNEKDKSKEIRLHVSCFNKGFVIS